MKNFTKNQKIAICGVGLIALLLVVIAAFSFTAYRNSSLALAKVHEDSAKDSILAYNVRMAQAIINDTIWNTPLEANLLQTVCDHLTGSLDENSETNVIRLTTDYPYDGNVDFVPLWQRRGYNPSILIPIFETSQKAFIKNHERFLRAFLEDTVAIRRIRANYDFPSILENCLPYLKGEKPSKEIKKQYEVLYVPYVQDSTWGVYGMDTLEYVQGWNELSSSLLKSGIFGDEMHLKNDFRMCFKVKELGPDAALAAAKIIYIWNRLAPNHLRN